VFLAVGVASMLLGKMLKTRLILLGLLLIPPIYADLRMRQWDPKSLEQVAEEVAGPVRAQSLEYRIENEQGITARALEHPWFGWGGYGRVFVMDEWGHCVYTPDSLWIITFGTYGIVGLASLMGLLIPVGVLLWRLPVATWFNATMAGAAISSMLMVFFAMDNLLNNMPNPIYLLGLGGIATLACSRSLRTSQAEMSKPAAIVHGNWQPASSF
jgi:hypothetical protein